MMALLIDYSLPKWLDVPLNVFFAIVFYYWFRRWQLPRLSQFPYRRIFHWFVVIFLLGSVMLSFMGCASVEGPPDQRVQQRDGRVNPYPLPDQLPKPLPDPYPCCCCYRPDLQVINYSCVRHVYCDQKPGCVCGAKSVACSPKATTELC